MFIVNIKGGLGNQLFQYNFALWLQEKFPAAEIRLGIWHFKNDSLHGGFQLGNVKFKTVRRIIQNISIVTDESFSSDISPKEDILFDGYWQDIKFLQKGYFTFSELFGVPIDAQNEKWEKLINDAEISVCVHVRCGDYNNHFVLGNIATSAYFNNAVANIKEQNPDAVFFVFSDDAEWAKANIHFGSSSAHFVAGNENPCRNKWDIYLMSRCKIAIISNSSFSWWATRFNLNAQKKVLVPPYWVNQKTEGFTGAVSTLQTFPFMESVPNVPRVLERPHEPFFSILLLAYNQEDCIRRAMASVLNQSFQDFELIVVDDFSTDSTFSVLAEYEGYNKKIRTIRHEKNSSCFCGRLTGINAASGKYVLFLDGDDWFFENALQQLHDEAEKNDGFDVLEFSYIRRPVDCKVPPVPHDGMSQLDYLCGSNAAVTLWNKLYDSHLLKTVSKKLPRAYINVGEDSVMSMCIALFANHFVQCDAIVTNYMLEGGVSNALPSIKSLEKNLESIKVALDTLNVFFLENSDEKTRERAMIASGERLLAWFLNNIESLSSSDDKLNLLLKLPYCFDSAIIRPVFEDVLSDCNKFRAGKFSPYYFLRSVYRWFKRHFGHIRAVQFIYGMTIRKIRGISCQKNKP